MSVVYGNIEMHSPFNYHVFFFVGVSPANSVYVYKKQLSEAKTSVFTMNIVLLPKVPFFRRKLLGLLIN